MHGRCCRFAVSGKAVLVCQALAITESPFYPTLMLGLSHRLALGCGHVIG